MLEDNITLKGRLRAYDEEGNKILDKENRILDNGLNYIVKILAAKYAGTESWYSTTDGEEYAVESVAVGDDNTPYYDIEATIEDLQGSQINEGEVQRTDDGYKLIDTGHFSFVFEVTNGDSDVPEDHYEVVITNMGVDITTYDADVETGTTTWDTGDTITYSDTDVYDVNWVKVKGVDTVVEHTDDDAGTITIDEDTNEQYVDVNYSLQDSFDNRLCMSRIVFEEPVGIGPEQTIFYVWDLILKR